MARWQVPGQPAFLAVNVYLVTGTGLKNENLQILEVTFEIVRTSLDAAGHRLVLGPALVFNHV